MTLGKPFLKTYIIPFHSFLNLFLCLESLSSRNEWWIVCDKKNCFLSKPTKKMKKRFQPCREYGIKKLLVLKVLWPLLHFRSQQKPQRRAKNIYIKKLQLTNPCDRDTAFYTQMPSNWLLLLTPNVTPQCWHEANTVPIHLDRLMARTLTHDDALILIFFSFFPPLFFLALLDASTVQCGEIH